MTYFMMAAAYHTCIYRHFAMRCHADIDISKASLSPGASGRALFLEDGGAYATLIIERAG